MKVNSKPRRKPGFMKLILSVLAFSIFTTVQAQTVSGTVSDENGKSLQGVSVTVKGAAGGATSDAEGRYSVPASATATLVFSYVGYTTTEIAVSGRTVINISMTVDSRSMSEVVVTALGITKQSRSLGYSTTNVNPNELTVNRTPNVMNALQGKVAGVNISALGTGPAGTSKIRIRGQSSISGQNNPLIVINGVPIDNTNFGSNPVGAGSNSDGSYNNRLGGGGGGSDATFRSALGTSSKLADTLYPNVCGPTLLLNLPPILNVLVKLFTPLFPPL